MGLERSDRSRFPELNFATPTELYAATLTEPIATDDDWGESVATDDDLHTRRQVATDDDWAFHSLSLTSM